ncbi:hypothetical protein AM1_A0267 (plasmid) [Acaryochloris marina MBIC11017]|uniref:Uncharacterized protein n=1 Tax=Acaryochloris marina (strain MBIC 11017) TaxID=329726 RepID=A8ZKR7_ACAM1|nr:hypothetical protein AM1_A0267 [Acaryochloris marina MBIC11017]
MDNYNQNTFSIINCLAVVFDDFTPVFCYDDIDVYSININP